MIPGVSDPKSNGKSSGRHVFEGAGHINLRLQVAKDPTGGLLFQVPHEEIDLEPDTIDPVAVKKSEILPLEAANKDGDVPAPPATDEAVAKAQGDGEAPRPHD
jgi:hypothetical protein